jgi:hypothetical protein
MLEFTPKETAMAKGGSNKSFGITFAGLFGLIALAPLLHGHPMRLWALPIVVILLTLAFFCPERMAFLNRLWTGFGALLHRITSPVILSVVFFLVITPMAVLMRLFGKDPMALNRTDCDSYWMPRNPVGPADFNQQF